MTHGVVFAGITTSTLSLHSTAPPTMRQAAVVAASVVVVAAARRRRGGWDPRSPEKVGRWCEETGRRKQPRSGLGKEGKMSLRLDPWHLPRPSLALCKARSGFGFRV